MNGDDIFHIALAHEWVAASAEGVYRISTLGLTLDEVGFIHCSARHQVAPTADRFYRGRDDLVVLTIDTGAVGAEIRLDDVEGSAEPFPHIYGPLDVAAVTEVVPLPLGPDGHFTFPT